MFTTLALSGGSLEAEDVRKLQKGWLERDTSCTHPKPRCRQVPWVTSCWGAGLEQALPIPLLPLLWVYWAGQDRELQHCSENKAKAIFCSLTRWII